MKEILLNKRFVAKVDDEDYESLNQYRWFAKRDRNTYYAYRRKVVNKKRHEIAMHREILDAPKGMQVDHKDWDGLNNQRSNIRLCTANDNCRWVRPRSNTGFLGVSRHTNTSTSGRISSHYTVSLKCNGTVHYLGVYKDPIVAAKAFNDKARELFGEFANLNIIPETIMEKSRGPVITVMQPTVKNVSNVPSENVASNVLCRNGNPLKYRDCIEYDTVFCRTECEFGPKEKPADEVNLDYQREDGK